MKKNFTLFIFFFLYAILQPFASVGQRESNRDVILMLKWNHQFQFAGYYAALKNGYYKEEGLNVTLLENNTNRPTADLVVNGDADYGVGASELVISRCEGKPVVVLAVIFQHSPLALISRYDSNLRYLSDYIGKTVMSTTSDRNEINLMFKKEGISPDKIHYVDQEYSIDAMINHRVDASANFITMQPNQMLQAGVEPRIIRPVDYGIDFYGDALFTTEKEISVNPGRVEQLTRATLKGWNYAMSHQEEIIDYILSLPNVQKRGITREQLQYESRKLEEAIQPQLIEIGQINPHRWEKMAQMFASQGIIKSDWSLEGFIYDPNNPEHRYRILARIVVVLFVSVVIMLLIVLVVSKKLKNQVNKRTAELSEVTDRDEALLHAIPDLLLVFNRDSVIVDCHPRDEKNFFFAPPSQFIGKCVTDVLPIEVSSQTKLNVSKVFDDGKMCIHSFSLSYNSTEKHFEARFAPCGKNEVLALVRDITERVVHERALESSREKLNAASEALKANLVELKEAKIKAEEANLLKSHFLTNMSHEIRTPMNGILGFIQILHEMDLSKEEQDTYIELLNESGKRLLDTINNIIEMSKIESGYVEIKNSETNMGEMLGYLYNFFKPMASRKGLELYMDITEEEKKFTFVTDQHKVETILTNLIRNAIKFTESGVVMFGFSHTPKEIVFYVKDTGIGIAKDRSDVIFERFVQADLDLSRKHEGAGLGLSISKGYVEILKGKIWVESDEGNGSKFFFSLPLPK